MAKIFTITEGLENMGALKSGGQGSVYKGRRIGEIITAIKLLPTPVFSESKDDKNYQSFLNEVQKLKKVNEEPNPHVVKILSSGITESGNFPFIEMEFIEGPDLEDLLKPPHNPIFTIKEVIKVADQLSYALAHCHRLEIKHGDIKSNNVKFNINSGNYVLLDFGLAIMSDEQRRTSFRLAGAIEFMAPEQNEGEMLFQSDVYSLGVILFELLAGTVPFPLRDKSETARNQVVVAHLESPPPDLVSLRRQVLPAGWTEEQKKHEMQVPDWLVSMIYRCLEKDPANRFETGVELHQHLIQSSIRPSDFASISNEREVFLEEENKRLREELYYMQQQLHQFEQQQKSLNTRSRVTPVSSLPRFSATQVPAKKKINLKFLIIGLAIILVAVACYLLFTDTSKPDDRNLATSTVVDQEVLREEQDPKIVSQLESAKKFLDANKMVEALTIYNELSKHEVVEAMYQYAKLALQNKNNNLSCADAFNMMVSAGDKGYVPAKRTLGIIYSFADDEPTLREANYYERCSFTKDVSKGSRYLTEAMLQGDNVAGQLLEELKKRYPNR